MLTDEPPNVVSEKGLRDLLDEGYQALVVCQRSVEKRGPQWSGSWIVWALGGDGRGNRLLVTTRGSLAPREFKNTNGLIAFLRRMGFDPVSIPLGKDSRAVQASAAAAEASDREPSR